MADRSEVIEALLDAAFHDLQHDTGAGDTEAEYLEQRAILKDRFKKILRRLKPAKPKDQP